MSVVVAIKDDNGGVWLGCDSQVSTHFEKWVLTDPNNHKIFKVKNNKNLIIGFVGSLRDRDIFYCEDSYIDELTELKDEFDYKYVVKTLVPKVFDILRKNKRLEIEDGIEYMCSQLVFAYKDKIFTIGGDGCVIESNNFAVVGSGTYHSTGKLNGVDIEKCEDKKQLCIDAVKSACESQLHVYYPIVVMNTMTNEVEVIEKE